MLHANTANMFRGHKTWQGLYLMTDPMASFESLNALVRTQSAMRCRCYSTFLQGRCPNSCGPRSAKRVQFNSRNYTFIIKEYNEKEEMKAPYDTAWYSKPKEKSIIFRLQHLFL